MAFSAPTAMHGYQDAGEPFLDGHQHPYQAQANATMQDPSKAAYFQTSMPPQISCDIKPRLTKEQHDILEAHYQKQPKPNTLTKKGFAESLSVSLDKVNNWFQNRRAKSKQDAKKAGAYNTFSQQGGNPNYSDSDVSPAFSSYEYSTMMQQCATDEQASNGFGMAHVPQFQAHAHQVQQYQSSHSASNDDLLYSTLPVHYNGQDMYDSPQEMNRRTLTQEAFDVLAQNGGMMEQPGQFDILKHESLNNSDLLDHGFPTMQQANFKQEDAFTFPPSYDAPMSSDSSTVPSSDSEQSTYTVSSLGEHASVSASPDEWTSSRSSSVPSASSNDAPSQYPQMPPATQQTMAASSQWQPGQSKPVELSALQKQFRDAQALQQTSQQQLQQQQQVEQPLAWPEEDFVRRDSQTSTMLTQQMSQFALQTPQVQDGQFKPPAQPASSIAARRQVKRPAALGIASMRSASYGANTQPASPSHLANNAQQPLRRIRSSVNMNSVAQGRVIKGMVGPAQRSPLNFSFSESLNSPKALRHASTSSGTINNLAPPTPLSPTEIPRSDSVRQHFSQWQATGQVGHQASISETDAEHNACFNPSTSAPPQHNFSSPPHTPMFNQFSQQYIHGYGSNHMMLENTPPQSAPASQQSFPSNVFMMPQQPAAPQMQALIPNPPQQFMTTSMPEQYAVSLMPFAPAQQFVMPLQQGVPAQPMQFPPLAPVDTQAMASMMAMPPPPMQPMQFIQHAPPQGHTPVPQQHMRSPPQGQYSFVTTSSSPPGAHTTPQLLKQAQPAAGLFVHEYSPPQDVKQAAMPRKSVDLVPKNYTFANHGPEHFEKDKAKKGSVASSSSPESALSG